MSRKYSFDEAVEAIDKLPSDSDAKKAEEIVKGTRKADKGAVLDYAILKGFDVMEE